MNEKRCTEMFEYAINDNSVIELEHKISVVDQADVIVAGGGVAGLGAAIAAARTGVRTILVERYSFLGGVATANMMQAISSGKFIDGVMVELLERMTKKGGATNWDIKERTDQMTDGFMNEAITFDIECLKETAMEMCLESNVILYLYTQAVAPIVIDNKIVGIIVESKGGRQAILGKRVVDCTGDGDLLYKAGVPYVFGRESIDNKTRPFVLMFRIGGMNVPKILEYLDKHPDQWQAQYHVASQRKVGENNIITRMSGFWDLVEKAKSNGDLYETIHYLRFEAVFIEQGIALCNTTRIYNVDGTNPVDLTKGEIEGRQQMKKLLSFMRKYVPGLENAFIIDVAPSLGVRETRRFIGEYFLTDDDCYDLKTFNDCIITVTRLMPIKEKRYDLDTHPVIPIEGSDKYFGVDRKDAKTTYLAPHKFCLNYRMLLPKGIENMLYAGRIMSTTHFVEAYARVMTICMRLGQVAGTAAALSLKENISPKALSFDVLKKELLRQGYTRF